MENQVIHALISTEEYRESPDFMNVNLSDFALFLAVMKHKEAQECVLSIILDEPNLRLIQVRVEDVILNKKWKTRNPARCLGAGGGFQAICYRDAE